MDPSPLLGQIPNFHRFFMMASLRVVAGIMITMVLSQFMMERHLFQPESSFPQKWVKKIKQSEKEMEIPLRVQQVSRFIGWEFLWFFGQFDI